MIHVPKQVEDEPPFIAEIMHEPQHGGHFEPICRVRLGSGIRRLLRELSADRLHDILAVVSFTTNNGRAAPSALEVSGALGVFEWQARLRLHRLAKLTWDGEPVVRPVRQSSGRITFVPSTTVLLQREVHPPKAATVTVAPAAREAVVISSRKKYSVPRQIVEQQLLVAHGWQTASEINTIRDATAATYPKENQQMWAVQRLMKSGVDGRLAVKLVDEYGASNCISQVQWLPYRSGIKQPARYLVGAIQRGYAAPPDAPSFFEEQLG